jgi:hypothetical protein
MFVLLDFVLLRIDLPVELTFCNALRSGNGPGIWWPIECVSSSV